MRWSCFFNIIVRFSILTTYSLHLLHPLFYLDIYFAKKHLKLELSYKLGSPSFSIVHKTGRHWPRIAPGIEKSYISRSSSLSDDHWPEIDKSDTPHPLPITIPSMYYHNLPTPPHDNQDHHHLHDHDHDHEDQPGLPRLNPRASEIVSSTFVRFCTNYPHLVAVVVKMVVRMIRMMMRRRLMMMMIR